MKNLTLLSLALLLFCVVLYGCSAPVKTTAAFAPNNSRLNSVRLVAVLSFNEPIQKPARSAHFGTIIDEKNPGVTLARKFSEKLLISGRFNVIERSAIDKVIEEQRLSFSDLSDQRNALKLGKLMGADSIIIGEVQRAETFNRFGSSCWRFIASIRLIDTNTGEVLMIANIDRGRETEGVNMNDTMTKVVDEECTAIVDQLINKSIPKGRKSSLN